MLKQLTNVQVWVDDQDEALAFYTEKLGLELREDELGFKFDYIFVCSVTGSTQAGMIVGFAADGRASRVIGIDASAKPNETREQVKSLLAKGASGGLFFATDDVQRAYEELKSRGVEFQQEPTEQPYGIDAGFRDPSGNSMRMAQRSDIG